MGVKEAYILSGILFLSSFCMIQSRKKCGPGSECILLSSCPEMVELIKAGNPADIATVSKNICKFVGRKTKVCCSITSQPNSLLPSKCGYSASDDDRIINGTKSPLGADPWMAALGYTVPRDNKPTFECAGTIISSKYVLTAAHCVDREELGRKKLSMIHLGDYNLASETDCEETKLGLKCSHPHIVSGVEEIISHPMYNKRGMSSDDVALIRLSLTLDFENSAANIEPLCLPPNGFNFKAFSKERKPMATGWGYTERGIKSNILLRVKIPAVDEDVCRDLYQDKFVGNQLCVGGSDKGWDTCKEDSGGPLVMSDKNGHPYFQVGIVSFGPNLCGLKGVPSVYANVADYKDWIIGNMRP